MNDCRPPPIFGGLYSKGARSTILEYIDLGPHLGRGISDVDSNPDLEGFRTDKNISEDQICQMGFTLH